MQKTPIGLRLVTGRTRRDRGPVQPVVAEGEIGSPPHRLSAGQRRIWREIVADAPAGLLARSDRAALEAYVVLRDLHRAALEAWNKSGGEILVRNAEGLPTTHAAVKELRRLAGPLRAAECKLGLNPISRGTVEKAEVVPYRGKLAKYAG